MMPAEARVRTEERIALRRQLRVPLGDGEVGIGDDLLRSPAVHDNGESSDRPKHRHGRGRAARPMPRKSTVFCVPSDD